MPSQLAFAAHLGEEGANEESSKDSSDYMVVNRANGSRVTVYIRSVAAYKHIPWVCAMLANYTYLLQSTRRLYLSMLHGLERQQRLQINEAWDSSCAESPKYTSCME